MLDKIELLCHNCIRIQTDKIIYTDPFQLEKNYHDADIVFITHSHYDHFSPEDIEKVRCDKTKLVVTEDLYEKSMKIGFNKNTIITVKPKEDYKVQGIHFYTVPAYNTNKEFHPKENNWVGYILEIEGKNYYIAGDTDITEEAKKVKCDVAFLPIGGTYTTTAEEAAELAKCIQPKIVIPVHYGAVVGKKEDADIFKKALNNQIECRILL